MKNVNSAAAQDTNATATNASDATNAPNVSDKAPAATPEPAVTDPLAQAKPNERGNPDKPAVGKNGLLGGEEGEEKAEEPAGGDKPAEEREGEDGQEGAPRYEPFTLPDGFVEDQGAMDAARAFAGKNRFSQEQAQEMVDVYTGIKQREAREQADALARNDAAWLKEIQGHPEFGGAKLPETSEKVSAMIRRFGSPVLTAQIRQMNIGNWPEMFYLLARVADAVGEDVSPAGDAGAKASRGEELKGMFPGVE